MTEDLALHGAGLGTNASATVLLVDDEPALLGATARLLHRAGFRTLRCSDGIQAMAALEANEVHAIITDIAMPNLDGLQLLRTVRRKDFDLPVILMTGGPTLDSAIDALEWGAFKYLLKPVDVDKLVKVTRQAVHLNLLARAKLEAFDALGGRNGAGSDVLGLRAAFESALHSLWPAFQPIVSAADGAVVAYEALLRSNEPALPHPGAVLDAAERLNQLQLLSRTMRAKTAAEFCATEPPLQLFLNLHPHDLVDDELLDSSSVTKGAASRIVLEVTERATLDRIGDVRARVAALRDAGYRIAIDDLGAGYAGLTSFATLEPEYVKLDMGLIRDVHESPVKQRLVRLMTTLCHDMNMLVVAEGIETMAERETVVELGCDLLQGYRFGKPQAGFTDASW